jgi:hypothetical protein
MRRLNAVALPFVTGSFLFPGNKTRFGATYMDSGADTPNSASPLRITFCTAEIK